MTEQEPERSSIAYDDLAYADLDELGDMSEAELRIHFAELASRATAAQLAAFLHGDSRLAEHETKADLVATFVTRRLDKIRTLSKVRKMTSWLPDA